MVQFDDQGNYLVHFLLPLAAIAYLLVLVLRRGSLLQWTIAAIVALLVYFFLNKAWPATYPASGNLMLLACMGIFAALLFLGNAAAGVLMIVALLSIAVPTLQHNADLIATYLGAPEWMAWIVLGSGLLLLVVLIYLSRIYPFVRLLLKVGFTSLFLQMMLRQLWLEHPPELDRIDMACFTASTDPPNRCSLSFDSYVWIGIFVLLVLIQCAALYACRCKKTKKTKEQKPSQAVTVASYRRVEPVQAATAVADEEELLF